MPILRVGGWIMISNVVSPIMVYLDGSSSVRCSG